jgi:hypothetical protein
MRAGTRPPARNKDALALSKELAQTTDDELYEGILVAADFARRTGASWTQAFLAECLGTSEGRLNTNLSDRARHDQRFAWRRKLGLLAPKRGHGRPPQR